MYNSNLRFHFCGIGGSGMSGLAEVLLDQGFQVSGSDLKEGPTCVRLRERGALVTIGHAAENVSDEVSVVVFSSAVPQSNPELVRARELGIPVIRRAEVLAELMRLKYGIGIAGSHGKTTTTSMTGAILQAGGVEPTVIIGGIVKADGSGGRMGKGDFLVAECDESDRSFLLLKPSIAVVTNIDAEHMNAYASLEELEASFEAFLQSIPFYGLAVVCIDDSRLRSMVTRLRCRTITYGRSPDADIQFSTISQSKGVTRYQLLVHGKEAGAVELALPGEHLASNSLAAIAIGLELGIDLDTIKGALASFEGVGRRAECVGVVEGVTLIDDYGHHPTEIEATIKAIKRGWCAEGQTLRVVFQPHRFSRTRDCFVDFIHAFDEANHLYLTDVYPAGEEPIDGITTPALVAAMGHWGEPSGKTESTQESRNSIVYRSSLQDVQEALLQDLVPGDVVLCLGAGPIGKLAGDLFDRLTQYRLTQCQEFEISESKKVA